FGGWFTDYEDYATQSQELKRTLQHLSSSLQVQAERAVDKVRHAIKNSNLNNPPFTPTPPTKDVLGNLEYKSFVAHFAILETQVQNFQTIQKRQQELEGFKSKVTALENTLQERLEALNTCCTTLQERIQEFRVQDIWRAEDLSALHELHLSACMQELEKVFEEEKQLVERFKKEWRCSVSASPQLKTTLQDRLQKLQETIQNKAFNLQDLASTLLAVAINGDEFLLLHLGDGICGVLKDRTLVVASHPDKMANLAMRLSSPLLKMPL
ncbi:protein phosphatase 2C domain-containing protein, partial [Helicobacter salomonis]|uniref:protein phosphatase 2C domain-containing protein n=1 Tax=Helicobacter salomonis TaxID=56878 RepID=UPI002278F6B0